MNNLLAYLNENPNGWGPATPHQRYLASKRAVNPPTEAQAQASWDEFQTGVGNFVRDATPGFRDLEAHQRGEYVDPQKAGWNLVENFGGAPMAHRVAQGMGAAAGPFMASVGGVKPKGITAYHGSPHDFDRFDMSKIGTGEGAQAYGSGLYFAESRDVADSYRNALAPRNVPSSTLNGRLYEVNIKANADDFLDWDKPLSQQSETVKRAVEDYAKKDRRTDWGSWQENQPVSYYLPAANGRAVDMGYRLRDAGIPGIRYLDQGSRAAGDGSRNYVVFDDSLVDILRKYGLAGLTAGGAVAASQPEPQNKLLQYGAY